MSMRFREMLNDSAVIEEWNDMTAEEQAKFHNKSATFEPFAHFVSCKVDKEKRDRRKAGKLTY